MQRTQNELSPTTTPTMARKVDAAFPTIDDIFSHDGICVEADRKLTAAGTYENKSTPNFDYFGGASILAEDEVAVLASS
jgi:hypothetical protein